MTWFRKDDAFAEAMRPQLTALRTPAASPELRERILADRAAGARVILPVARGGRRSVARYAIAAALVGIALLGLPFYRTTRDDARDTPSAALFSYFGAVVGAREAPSSMPASPPAFPIHPERMRAGTLEYLRVWRDTAQRVTTRVSDVYSITAADTAWRIVETARSARAATVETLLVAKRDLRLLARSVHVRPYRRWKGINIEQRFTGDSVNGRMTLDEVTGMRRIARRLPSAYAPYLADALVPTYFASVPLQSAWQGRVAALGWAVVPNDVFVLVDVRVAGEDDVRVPAGRFACWKLAVRYPGGSLDYWVRKSDGVAVRGLERQSNGGQRELTLVREGGM